MRGCPHADQGSPSLCRCAGLHWDGTQGRQDSKRTGSASGATCRGAGGWQPTMPDCHFPPHPSKNFRRQPVLTDVGVAQGKVQGEEREQALAPARIDAAVPQDEPREEGCQERSGGAGERHACMAGGARDPVRRHTSDGKLSVEKKGCGSLDRALPAGPPGRCRCTRARPTVKGREAGTRSRKPASSLDAAFKLAALQQWGPRRAEGVRRGGKAKCPLWRGAAGGRGQRPGTSVGQRAMRPATHTLCCSSAPLLLQNRPLILRLAARLSRPSVAGFLALDKPWCSRSRERTQPLSLPAAHKPPHIKNSLPPPSRHAQRAWPYMNQTKPPSTSNPRIARILPLPWPTQGHGDGHKVWVRPRHMAAGSLQVKCRRCRRNGRLAFLAAQARCHKMPPAR